MINVGERIKDMRENIDVNQEELGKYLNVSKSTICHYERNDRDIPLRKLVLISKFFQCSIDYIFDFTNIKKYDDLTYHVDLEKTASRIKEICIDQNWTNVSFAKELNTTESNIRKYKTGKTLILASFALQLSDKYDYSMDWLAGISNNKYVVKKKEKEKTTI